MRILGIESSCDETGVALVDATGDALPRLLFRCQIAGGLWTIYTQNRAAHANQRAVGQEITKCGSVRIFVDSQLALVAIEACFGAIRSANPRAICGLPEQTCLSI